MNSAEIQKAVEIADKLIYHSNSVLKTLTEINNLIKEYNDYLSDELEALKKGEVYER